MIKVILPNFDVNEQEATITDVLVEEGAFVARGDILFKAENTKAIKDITADEEGFIKIQCKRFDVIKMGSVLATIYATKQEYEDNQNENIQSENTLNADTENLNATQKAIKLAEELNISIIDVCKSKPNGIVKVGDVQEFADKQNEKKSITSNVPGLRMRINKYDRERVVIIGAGKGAEVAIDILLDDKDKYVVGLVDSYEKEFESYNYPLLSCNVYDFPEKIDRHLYDTAIIMLGSTLKTMPLKKELFQLYKEKGIKFTNVIADDVNIRRAVRIGEGNIIMHNCYIGTGTVIGDNNMISYGMNLGHHSIMGSHNLIAPGFTAAGCVEIGSDCIIMTGVKTRNFLKIGNNVVLPVGYSVDSDIKDGTIIGKSM